MKTSIVILTYNKLKYTQKCIKSIRQYTITGTYEIIIVDNNSSDGTVKWLQKQKDLKVIYNTVNRGFPKGCNQGMEIAEGDAILLLNNDVIVTENWLNNLLNCLYSHEKIGAVGPVTNKCSYYQAIKVNYKTEQEMHRFARKHNKLNPEKWEERLKLIGYCMLIKRAVLDEVGLLDEQYSPGNFEDDDLSFRMMRAGYKLMLCKDTFIHHFGSVSFGVNPEFESLLQQNKKKFADKWGFDAHYSTNFRSDIINLIDAEAQDHLNVLEIGCACGGTLLKIKSLFKNAGLYGIELNKRAAQISSLFAEVSAQNIEAGPLSFPESFFDYIIFADVLEHLYEPLRVLKNMKKYLKDDGKILASIPNIMHFSVVKGIIAGQWTYQEAGILDKKHIRFFTLSEIDKLFKHAGFTDLQYNSVAIGKSEQDDKFIKSLAAISDPNNARQFEAYQYLVRAMKEPALQVAPISSAQNASSTLSNASMARQLVLLEAAYKLDPQSSTTVYNMAKIIDKLGDKQTALRFLKSLKEKDERIDSLIKEIAEG